MLQKPLEKHKKPRPEIKYKEVIENDEDLIFNGTYEIDAPLSINPALQSHRDNTFPVDEPCCSRNAECHHHRQNWQDDDFDSDEVEIKFLIS